MNAGEFVRGNIHHGANHGGQKLPTVRKLQPRVKANCRAIWKLKPACLDKVSLGQRSLRGNGCSPERSRPADSIDGIVGGLRGGSHTCGLRCGPLMVPSQSRANMIAARLPVVVSVAMNNKAVRNEANG